MGFKFILACIAVCVLGFLLLHSRNGSIDFNMEGNNAKKSTGFSSKSSSLFSDNKNASVEARQTGPAQGVATYLDSTSIAQDPIHVAIYYDKRISDKEKLKALQLHTFLKKSEPNLLDFMKLVSRQNKCLKKPLFIAMAQVQSDLYWQLVENFMHSMVQFDHIDCVVMICISDPACVRLCAENSFPCFNYVHPNASTIHIMEQIATIKLLEVSRALEAGITVLLLDLDVGFLKDPLQLFDGFMTDPFDLVRAQMDLQTSTNKSSNTQYAYPSPNFGVFLIKSHPHSIKLMQRAWKHYGKATEVNKRRVATDQNAMTGALKWARWRWDYNFSYFSAGYLLDTQPRPILRDKKAYLLDKIYRIFPNNPIIPELGGSLARAALDNVILVHSTCYEKAIKVQGLKASNAFWNNEYYDPYRKTLTKPIMFLSKRSLDEELKTLGYIAWKTGRSLMMPNVLIGMGGNVSGFGDKVHCRAIQYRSPYCNELRHGYTMLSRQDMSHCGRFRGELYWPWWRTLYTSNSSEISVIEPSYYYRISEDNKLAIPRAVVVPIAINTTYYGEASTYYIPSDSKVNKKRIGDTNRKRNSSKNRQFGLVNAEGHNESIYHSVMQRPSARTDMETINKIISVLNSSPYKNIPRLVLDVRHTDLGFKYRGGPIDDDAFQHWIDSSISDWSGGDASQIEIFDSSKSGKTKMGKMKSNSVPKYLYLPLPALPVNSFPFQFKDSYRLCSRFLLPTMGNRSCFSKCK